VLLKQTVRQQHMEMGMPAGIIVKGLDGHDRAQGATFLTGRRAGTFLPCEKHYNLNNRIFYISR
jgi:hypothetical protein